MQFTTITTAQAMQRMANFIQAIPAEKVAYVRKRSELLGQDILSGLTDNELLNHLKNIENLMQRFIDQYEKQKDSITHDLLLNTKLLALANDFINTAVTAGIERILCVLDRQNKTMPPQIDQDINAAIDSLFTDRNHLQNKLQYMLSLIKKPEIISEIIYTDLVTFNNVYQPITSPGKSLGAVNYGLAFLSFMGIDLCMLINHRCIEANKIYTPKVSGFSHEFYLYILLHELTHLLLESDDNSYSYSAEDEVKDFNVYSTANLKADEINNADNYSTLIFITLALLHKEGCIDLRRF
jgi:hypothetical protein